MTIRLLSMWATLMQAISDARSPRRIRGGGQRGARLQARHRLHEAHDLVGTRHD
jgi:hypothetical protein